LSAELTKNALFRLFFDDFAHWVGFRLLQRLFYRFDVVTTSKQRRFNVLCWLGCNI